MNEIISEIFGIGIVFVFFTFFLLSQIKDHNLDIRLKRLTSRRLVFGHKLTILSFYGFLFFYSFHYLIQYGLFTNEVIFPGETPQIFIFVTFYCIFIGKYLVHSAKAKVHSYKMLYKKNSCNPGVFFDDANLNEFLSINCSLLFSIQKRRLCVKLLLSM